MDDPQAQGVEADGVQWMLEESEGSGPRFTTTYRKAYVEVTLSSAYAHDITPLAAFSLPRREDGARQVLNPAAGFVSAVRWSGSAPPG